MNYPATMYTRYELRAPPISGGWGDHVQKSLFYTSLWRLTDQDRRLAVAFNVGFVK